MIEEYLSQVAQDPTLLCIPCCVGLVLLVIVGAVLYRLANPSTDGMLPTQYEYQPDAPAPQDVELGAANEPSAEEEAPIEEEEEEEIPPMRIEVNLAGGKQVVITCDSLTDFESENGWVSFTWSDDGIVTITDETGEKIEHDSESDEKQASWDNVVSWICLSGEDFANPPDADDVETDIEVNNVVTLNLADGRTVIIEMKDYDDEDQDKGHVAFSIEGLGYVRIKDGDTVRVLDSNQGRVIVSYSGISKFQMD